MIYFAKGMLSDTIKSVVSALSTGNFQQVLFSSRISRIGIEDLKIVIAEHGVTVTIPHNRIKAYFTEGEEPAEMLFVDVRLEVDNKPSDLILRCTFFNTLKDGLYEYQVDDILAP